MAIGYAANGMPDYGADQMYRACKNAGVQNEDYGPISTLPELPGLMLWKSGHAGVYIGGGYVIEAMGTRKGVVKTKVSDRGWQGWGKLPYIDYREGREWQRRLICGRYASNTAYRFLSWNGTAAPVINI